MFQTSSVLYHSRALLTAELWTTRQAYAVLYCMVPLTEIVIGLQTARHTLIGVFMIWRNPRSGPRPSNKITHADEGTSTTAARHVSWHVARYCEKLNAA